MRLATTAGIFLAISMGGLRAQQSAKSSCPVWETAKIVDSHTAKTTSVNESIRDTQLMLVSNEFAYVINDARGGVPTGGVVRRLAAGIAARHRGCRFIVGDDVNFYQVKDVLHVIDADHMECKAEILRQVRLNQTAQPAEARKPAQRPNR